MGYDERTMNEPSLCFGNEHELTWSSRSLSRYVREHTAGGEALVDFLIGVVNGEITEAQVTAQGTVVVTPADMRVRFLAAGMLLDRGWGKDCKVEDEKGEMMVPILRILSKDETRNSYLAFLKAGGRPPDDGSR